MSCPQQSILKEGNPMRARTLVAALSILAASCFIAFNSGCKSGSTLTTDPCKGQGLSASGCAAKIREIKEHEEEAKRINDETHRLDGLQKGDPSTPESQFVELNSGYQLATLFYALSGMPPDYDVLASAASEEYRTTSDEFRKRDLMQALRPKIDTQIAAYKDTHNRYFRIVIADQLPLGHYDFNSRAFPVTTELGPDRYLYFNDASKYSISYSNGSAFQKFPVVEEQRAKQIEDMITKGQTWNGRATAYLFVQAADTTQNRVNAQILHVVLEQSGHREIGRY
jgi:hypothetical protein